MNPVRFLLLIVTLAVVSSFAMAQEGGPGSAGTEFVVSFPTNYSDPTATTQYIRLYITAKTRTFVRIYTGTTLRKEIYSVPFDVVTADLTKHEAQVVNRGAYDPVPDDQILRGRAIRVVADEPIALYGMNRTSYTSDGMLVLPTSALGRRYVVGVAANVQVFGNQSLPGQFLISAPFDSTDVTIVPAAATVSHAAAQPFTVRLDAGDVFSAMGASAPGDLTGSTITATKPVAVTAGNACAYVPSTDYVACDHIAEMLFPTEAWGRTYHFVPTVGRLKADMLRIFASGPDTEIFINGTKTHTLPGGSTRDAGWVEYLPPTLAPLEIRASAPIAVVQYNTSQSYDNVAGDPFSMSLVPAEQFQRRFIFTSPKPGDFAQNHLTLVADSVGYAGIEIKAAGSAEWKSITLLNNRAVVPFAHAAGAPAYVGTTLTLTPGAFEIRGQRPFTLYAYGSDSFDSYGYPLSTAAAFVASPDTAAPVFERTQSANGDVTGAITDKPDDPVLRSNLASIYLMRESSTNYRIDVDAFEPGVTVTTGYRLTVFDPWLDARAVVQAHDKAGNAAYDTVAYTAPARPTIEVSDLSFPRTDIGGPAAIGQIAIRNTSDSRDLVLTALELSGSGAFTVIAPTLPLTIAPGAALFVPVEFRPGPTPGEYAASLLVRSTAAGGDSTAAITGSGGIYRVVAGGYAFGILSLDTDTIRFGTITLTNTGTENVLLRGIAMLTGDSVQFTVDTRPIDDRALAPLESVDVPVSYRPRAEGAHTLGIAWRTIPAAVASTSTLTGTATLPGGIAAGAAVLPELEISPNPSGIGSITVEHSARGPIALALVGPDGAVHRRWWWTGELGRGVLDVSDVAAGVYWLRLRAGAVSVSRAVVIVR